MNLLGKNKKWWFGFSILLFILGIIAIPTWKLKIGIDFTGGTLLEVAGSEKPIDRVTADQFISDLQRAGVENIASQSSGEMSLIVKASHIDQPKHERVIVLLKQYQLQERRFENVGPTVGKDLTRKAIIAVIIASIAIILYIAFSFRSLPRPASSWRFGVSAVLALIHDLFITVGIYAILSHFFGYEVDALFITALLTIMGFSVHDTIVVFDRLRENMRRSPIGNANMFEQVANDSLVQTLNRSLNTSLTVILVLLAMALLGGETVRPFIITLLIGITIGTYSSIGVATPLVVVWQSALMRRRPSSA